MAIPRHKICSQCGKNIYGNNTEIHWLRANKRFCNESCEKNFKEETGKTSFDFPEDLEKQKFEEIKSMALKFLLATAHRNNKEEVTIFGEIPEIWEFAEEFYNFAKEKERGHPKPKVIHCAFCGEVQAVSMKPKEKEGDKFTIPDLKTFTSHVTINGEEYVKKEKQDERER